MKIIKQLFFRKRYVEEEYNPYFNIEKHENKQKIKMIWKGVTSTVVVF